MYDFYFFLIDHNLRILKVIALLRHSVAHASLLIENLDNKRFISRMCYRYKHLKYIDGSLIRNGPFLAEECVRLIMLYFCFPCLLLWSNYPSHVK